MELKFNSSVPVHKGMDTINIRRVRYCVVRDGVVRGRATVDICA